MRFGPYTVEGELGRGGMGVVFRARSPEGREVALKVLLDSSNAEAIASFAREQRLSWGLGLAEGFVPILDAGAEAGRPFLVMPLLAGGTLRDRLRRGRMRPDDAVALAIRLADALARAHERGIVHRDLKPANVIFTADGVPLLADMGLAKHFRRDLLGASQSRSFTASGMIVGSPGYLAPEQLSDSKRISPAADVFALSVVLYECVTGKMPFEAQNLVEYTQALRARRPRLRELAPDAPRWLDAVCARGLAYDSAERFADGRAFAAALRAGPAARTRRGPAPVAATVVLVLGAGALVRGLATRRGGPPPTPPPSATAVAPRTPPRTGVAPVASPDAKKDLHKDAIVRFEAKDWDGAMAAFTRAIEVDPRDVGPWIDRALARAHLRDFAGARADIAKALELAPRDARVWCQRGLTRALEGNFQGAIEDHTTAIGLDPKFALAWTQRALARTKCGDFEGAEVDCRRALELDPRQPGAWAGIGYTQFQKNDLEGAIASMTKALAIDPRFVDALVIRSAARTRLHDSAGALADLDALIALEGAGAQAWRGRADVRMNLGDWKGAAADWEKVVELDPGSCDGWNGLGWCRAHAGDLEGGVAACERAVALQPGDAAALHSLGWARARKGNDAGAIAAFDRAIACDPRMPDAYRDRGRARERRGETAGAIADYERALELAPEHEESPEIRRALAKLRQ